MVASSRTFLLFSITIYRSYITELTSLTPIVAYIHKSLEDMDGVDYSTFWFMKTLKVILLFLPKFGIDKNMKCMRKYILLWMEL
jgi:hypothetical protein